MPSMLTFSEPGGHPENQDVVLVRAHPARPDFLIALVADGQGGQSGGKRAAELACETVWQTASGWTTDRLAAPLAWAYLLRKADLAVEQDATAGFTTLVVAGVTPTRIVGASCGDSAAYAFTPDEATDLTTRQPKNPPVGSGVAVGQVFDAPLQAPWRVLLMTDGVWKFAGPQLLRSTTRQTPAAELLTTLQAAARPNGRTDYFDDFTLSVIDSDA
jgi:serine/threonine protein phosphatase PrpC